MSPIHLMIPQSPTILFGAILFNLQTPRMARGTFRTAGLRSLVSGFIGVGLS